MNFDVGLGVATSERNDVEDDAAVAGGKIASTWLDVLGTLGAPAAGDVDVNSVVGAGGGGGGSAWNKSIWLLGRVNLIETY